MLGLNLGERAAHMTRRQRRASGNETALESKLLLLGRFEVRSRLSLSGLPPDERGRVNVE